MSARHAGGLGAGEEGAIADVGRVDDDRAGLSTS
jgi:hypothetical protein